MYYNAICAYVSNGGALSDIDNASPETVCRFIDCTFTETADYWKVTQ